MYQTGAVAAHPLFTAVYGLNLVVTPHLLQYTLESSNFRVSLEMAAQSLAAGGVNVGRASTVIVL